MLLDYINSLLELSAFYLVVLFLSCRAIEIVNHELIYA